jgi:uncharacterized membrane protein YdfJ with MMPL/SSD domain
MSTVLGRIGSFCAHHKWLVVTLWLLAVATHLVTVRAFGETTTNDFSLPGTQSQQATDLLAAEFPPQQNGSSPIVFHVTTGRLTDASNEAAVSQSVAAIQALPDVYSASDPTANPAAGQISADGKTAFSSVLLDVDSGNVTTEQAQSVVDAAEPARQAGIEVEAGGTIGTTLSSSPTETSELIGIMAAAVILTFTFGSLVAMGMPILMAVIGLLCALGLVNLIGRFTDIPSTGPTLATMIGLGVGIDYALFLVTRHRENMHSGMPVRASIVNAVSTAGGAVVFAGGTVVIALLSLGIARIPLVTALGLATPVAVAVAVLAALTLLPAMLSIVGPHLSAGALPSWLRPKPKPEGRGLWAAWAGWVTGHRVTSVLIALAIMIPLSLPLFTLRLGQPDTGVTDPASTQRKAFDLLADGFGPGYNGPFLIAVSLDPVATEDPAYKAQYQLANDLKDSLTQQQEELTDQANQLQQQQSQLQKQANQLQKEADSLKKQESKLKAQEAELRKQQAELERQEAALRAQAQQLRQQAEELVAQAKELRAERKALRKEVRQLDKAIANATSPAERQLLREERRAVKAELRSTRSDIKSLAQQARSIVQQAVALARQADQLAQQAAELQQEADVLKQQAAELQKQANQLAKQQAQLQQEADALQQQADELQTQQAAALAEQGQAIQLQSQLTAVLTKAGGNALGTDPRLVTLQNALSVPGVQLVGPPNVNESGSAATFPVIPEWRPAAEETAGLVVSLREEIIAPAQTAGLTVYIGGKTAANVDLATQITDRLPLVILTVLVLSFLLLMVAFRSLLIPLQAAITNLFSVAAAFGILTAVFQWGWGLSLIGLDSPYGTDPIASYVPLMMFAVLFGLSMDYEVFFVSSVQRFHAEGDPVRVAVRRGLASSAKVIVAAALIMVSVFGSFILNSDPTIKQFGVGLSAAILLAGIMVMLLAPALLALFGAATFAVPGWLGWLPHVDLEGAHVKPQAESGQQPDAIAGVAP